MMSINCWDRLYSFSPYYIYSDMDIDKELEDIFSDPLMDVSYQEAKLFDVPADMKGVMAQKKDAPDHVAQ